MLKTSDFDYYLPQHLIAQEPVEPRDSSRLAVFDRSTGALEHRHFYDICDYLKAGDVLVVNNTKVIPARIFGVRITSDCTYEKAATRDANCEVLLLKRIDADSWECIVKPGRKLRVGAEIYFSPKLGAKVCSAGDEGIRIIKFTCDGLFENVLEEVGAMPLPPYITHALKDKSRYNTVYCKREGSAAAPTAGLHFTPQLLDKARAMGVKVVEVLLHVGLGTFRPVKEDDALNHKMHSEYYEVSQQSADAINEARRRGGRIICVGTTSVRTLESAASDDGTIVAGSGNTEIFIYPGYKFKALDALITNFHLPKSTLLMLVSAFIGRENALNVYEECVKEEYRFFSFGDAMMIV